MEHDDDGFAARVHGRLDRLDLSVEQAAVAAGLPASVLDAVLRGERPVPRGRRLTTLADALSTSVSYLVGLDPDAPVPEEWLQEDQGSLGGGPGLLAGDEDALLRAYRRLDVASRASLLHVALRMAPEPQADERKPRQGRSAPAG